MENAMASTGEISNLDSPFTELFSLITFNEDLESKYTTEQLRYIYSHSENAIDAILRGMQDVGRVVGGAESQPDISISNFGFFVSTIFNLSEALNSLKSNISYIKTAWNS